ncbi:MAG: Gfo/Idh/MocA family oxidoreductase [Propionibacteriaceae bacterium]|nr:Gfo/Idh/MocA family oxidoreductase [Propionibacteriaceae bacterium]
MLRIATIGTSWITRQFALDAGSVAGLTIACAYSRDAGRAAEFAAEIGAAAASADLPGMLASPEVDAVYIASPNSAHFAQALAAIEAGKHVLVEKPATLTAAEFGELCAAATAHRVVVLEAMRTAYDPGLALVAAVLGELGVLRRASLRYCQRSSRYDQVLAGDRVNIFDPALGGGALNDIGYYCANAMVALFGEPRHVVGRWVTVPGGSDGAGTAIAVYPGLVVDLGWSKITASSLASEIEGELGFLTIDRIHSPRVLRLTRLDGTTQTHEVPGPEFTLAHGIQRFVDLCRSGGGAGADHARTLGALRVLEAIRASAQAGPGS